MNSAVQNHGRARYRPQGHCPQRLADIGFDRSITRTGAANMAASIVSRGRPTLFLGLSPGLDFESKLFAKPDAPQLLEKEHRRARITSRA